MQEPRVRRGRPDRRRRGLRRRGQGGDPRLAGVPPGNADVHREGISEVTAADVQSARDMGASSSCSRSASLGGPRGDDAVSVRGTRRDDPAARTRSASVREAYNAVFVESEAAGELMFYGPARAAPRPPRPCSATWSRSPATGWPTPAAPAESAPPTDPCCRWARPSPATTSRSTSTTAPACSPRSPGLRREHGVDPDGPPGGPRRRRPARRGLARGDRTPAWRDGRPPATDGHGPRGHPSCASRRCAE